MCIIYLNDNKVKIKREKLNSFCPAAYPVNIIIHILFSGRRDFSEWGVLLYFLLSERCILLLQYINVIILIQYTIYVLLDTIIIHIAYEYNIYIYINLFSFPKLILRTPLKYIK